MNNSIEQVLKQTNEKDTLHRWIDEQPLGAKFLILASVSEPTKDVYRYCCSDDLTVNESNWLIDVYKRYLMDSAANP